jgi:hypothetical protein
MKAVLYIMGLVTILLSSCVTSKYVGGEYDDLYYTPSDQPVVSVRKDMPQQTAEGRLKPEQYYDNIYSGDTLVADGYNDAVDFDNSMFYNKDNSAFEYADDISYSNRLRRFYGNYFDPYWRDSFGYGFSPYMGFGSYGMYGGLGMYGGYGMYGGMYDPFYYGGSMYDPFYYGGYYGGGYYDRYYGSYYNPYWYGGYGYSYPGYFNRTDGRHDVPVGRRERSSTLTNNYNPAPPSSRSEYQSGTNPGGNARRSANPAQQGVQDQTRRGVNPNANSQIARPDYRSVNRTYTPSYNTPRMSTRPSYNNSRIQGGTNSYNTPENSKINNENSGRGSNYINRSNYNQGRSTTPAPSQGQLRSGSTNPGRSESYSVPSGRSSGGSTYSPGRSSEGSYSGSSRSSSFSSGGSSGSGASRSSSGSSGSSSGSSGTSGGSSGRR